MSLPIKEEDEDDPLETSVAIEEDFVKLDDDSDDDLPPIKPPAPVKKVSSTPQKLSGSASMGSNDFKRMQQAPQPRNTMQDESFRVTAKFVEEEEMTLADQLAQNK